MNQSDLLNLCLCKGNHFFCNKQAICFVYIFIKAKALREAWESVLMGGG